MKQKTKKLRYPKLDVIWKIIGALILILFIFDLIIIAKGIINNTLSLMVVISLLLYSIISVVVFYLPSFFKKLNQKLKKRD